MKRILAAIFLVLLLSTQALAGMASGPGDVTGVGDCASGACLDGSSDGGTYIRLYDGDSNYLQLDVGNLAGDVTHLFPIDALVLGDLWYGSAANTLSKLAGNTTTTQKFLSQTGDGANSAAPTWDTVPAGSMDDWYGYDTIPIAWCADGTSPPDALDDKTTRPPYQYRTFDSAADEDVNCVWFVPPDISGTTTAIQYRIKYLVTNATGPAADEGVAFGLSGVSIGDNDATNAAKGAVVVITDDALNASQWDILQTGWSGDVTVTNIAAGEVAELALIRDVSDAIDDYGQVVGVIGIEIRYVRDVTR